MTVYYTLTFMLLAAEACSVFQIMATFCILVAPLPYSFRKRLFTFLSESAIVAKVAYGLKISFIFVGILFIDAVQRMLRVTAETEMAKSGGHAMHDVRTETNFAARKFYAQRNTYLTGFCLFLSLILTRTFYIILDLIRTQGECAKLKQAVSSQTRKNFASEDQTKPIENLHDKLAAAEAKARDFDALKKENFQLNSEFDRLLVEYNNITGTKTNKRVD
ncbi:B-cell receptor-associated protein 31-like-domain-containing protein [Hysterangium stoloniferum]|nr:B-cell receptor-associated protein 31-like-domain-containing protein [Hysterangium stoloniferum]